MLKLIPQEEMVKHQDQLPHWQQGGRTYFITFNLLRGKLDEFERTIVSERILFEHGTKHRLHIGCVMPDHVHLLLTPWFEGKQWYSLESILKPIKGVSARMINRHRGKTGSIWQDESYDRMIRNSREFSSTWQYIEWNPVVQGLSGPDGEYAFTLIPGEPV